MLKIKNLTKVYGDKKAVATNRKRSMSVGDSRRQRHPIKEKILIIAFKIGCNPFAPML